MTRKYLYLVFFSAICLFSLNLRAQKSEGGIPPSFNYPSLLRSASGAQSVNADLDVKRLIWEDSIAERNGAPLRLAIEVPVDIDMKKTGHWRILPDSTRIWQHTISLEKASGVIISYNDFYIPPGGKLFIYNEDGTSVLGAYTHETYPQGGRFATEPVYGDIFTLEYVASPISQEEPRIVIEGLGYIYKSSACPEGERCSPQINSSRQKCMLNVNCEEGNAWKRQKQGVVLFFVKLLEDDQGFPRQVWSACTGSLVNNTNRDGKPYILSATHCFVKKPVMDQLIVYFNHEFSECANENVMTQYKSLVGAIPRAEIPLSHGSDTYLYELKEEVPKVWNPYYNGWDRRNNPANTGSVIHHPNYDVKKISLYRDQLTSGTWEQKLGSITTKGAANGHWRVVYSKGVTEAGSSGSPIFNENGLIIGTLSGGQSVCSNMNLADMYGKFWFAWDQYNDNVESQLKPYLDPSNKGVDYLEGYDPNNPSGIEDEWEENTKELILFPVPATDDLSINADSIIRGIDIYDMQGRVVFSRSNYSGSTAAINISNFPNGTYMIKVKTDQKSITDKFIKK